LHIIKQDASVASVLGSGLRATLVPRLITMGERELIVVEAFLTSVRLSDVVDTRALFRCRKRTGKLCVAELYTLCSFGGVEAPFASFIWDSFAPSRVKFLGWLLVQSRIQCCAAFLKKKIIQPVENICPICSAANESASHIILGCPFVRRFWNAVCGPFDAQESMRLLHKLPGVIAGETASTFTLLCCWSIWKHGNGVHFPW
jgi:hypothetical protein